MILNRKKKLSLIHVAKKECGLRDDEYRALLSGAAGITSLTELENEKQFRNIMGAFKKLGFTSQKPAPKPAPPPRKPEDVWGGTEAQRKKIETLWHTCARSKTEPALRKFIKRIAKVDHPRFMTVALARKVILALEKMSANAGFNPETGERDCQAEQA